MPGYLVQINVSNLLVDMEGRRDKYGFITFRSVEAADPAEAGRVAIQMVKDDKDTNGLLLNAPGDPPRMEVEEVKESDGLQGHQNRIWYEMNPRRWWQFWRP